MSRRVQLPALILPLLLPLPLLLFLLLHGHSWFMKHIYFTNIFFFTRISQIWTNNICNEVTWSFGLRVHFSRCRLEVFWRFVGFGGKTQGERVQGSTSACCLTVWLWFTLTVCGLFQLLFSEDREEAKRRNALICRDHEEPVSVQTVVLLKITVSILNIWNVSCLLLLSWVLSVLFAVMS